MNCRKYILLVVLMFSTANLYAQLNILGNVKDATTNKPLNGASIYLPELKIGTISDTNGNFSITNLKKGTYLLQITFTGYKTLSKKIDLLSNTTLNLLMESSAKELNEVIVTGVTHATELKRNPVIVATIDKAAFRENSATNLIDALKEIPGISQISTGPNISKPVIRGLGYNRIITLNNGIKQEGQQWGDEHGIEIDEYSIDRAEIIKGPGSLLYGSDGIAGVLNFLPPKPVLNGTVKTQLLTNYQSNNNLIGYSLSNAGNKNGFQWLGRFSNKYAGNYQNKYDGKVYNSGYKEYNGNLSLGITKRWGHSSLSFNSYNTTLGIVEGERDSVGNFIFEDMLGNEVSVSKNDLKGYTIGTPYQKVNHFSITSNNLFILNKGTIHTDIGFQQNRRREFEEAANPNEAALYLSLSTINYNIRYNVEKKNGWEASVGIGGMWQTNKNKGEEFLIPDYSLFDIGVFVFTQKTLDKLTLAGGLRFDNRNMHTKELYLDGNGEPIAIPDANSELKFAQFNKNYYGLSGSIGLSYQSSKNATLKFNFSNGFRAPNIAELASNGKHEGAFRYEIGNQNLKPEFSHQLDLAYLLNTEHITFEVSPFINFISHYSFLEKLKDINGNDVFPDPNDPAPAFQYTSGNATLVGGEIYIDIHPHPLDWLHIENSFSYVQATQNKQSDSTKYLPFIPAPHYRGGLKVELNNVSKSISNCYIKFNVDNYFAQNKVYSAFETETPTAAYTLFSAGVGASFKAFKKKDCINVYLSGNNLTNIGYQNHLSRLKYAPENLVSGRTGVYNMGRNISLKMIVNL
ncbi:MAG: TonB-dependent receptor [Chitinophagaceae bacterium]|nr:TonB-dependent receptor [Chitinophagaceae bacterium]MCW5905820.1 TonB-dependent receptor [Chitinophagaceae bacterium]